jgi:hypothetical protein
MKLYEKYAKLRQKSFVTEMIINSVCGSMALEQQAVPELQVRALVIAHLREAELQGRKFAQN